MNNGKLLLSQNCMHAENMVAPIDLTTFDTNENIFQMLLQYLGRNQQEMNLTTVNLKKLLTILISFKTEIPNSNLNLASSSRRYQL